MRKEEYTQIVAEINDLAVQYECDKGNFRLRERIWLLLWEIRMSFFWQKDVRRYLSWPPSSLYETGEEFLTEVFLDAVPRLLDSYKQKQVQKDHTVAERTFVQYLFYCFPVQVKKALADIESGYIRVRDPSVPVYQSPQEDAVIPNVCLTCGMERRIISRIPTERGGWVKTELKKHGRIVFVKETGIDIYEKSPVLDIDEASNISSPDGPDGRINIEDIYETHILDLFILTERLYERSGKGRKGSFQKRDCFKLLYTETLLGILKRVYDAGGTVKSKHERESLSIAEIEFIDYLLTDKCRDFLSIAMTPFHVYRHFKYLKKNLDEEIQIPIPNAVYEHFLVVEKKLNLKFESIETSISRNRKEFNKQYHLLCQTELG